MRLLLIDGNNLFWRCFWGLQKSQLSSTSGRGTWGTYGAINAVLHDIRTYSATHVAVLFDRGRSKLRTNIMSTYKADRPSDRVNEINEQMQDFQVLLSHIGIPHTSLDGVEADDLIASLVTQYSSAFDAVVIVSADHDLRQLISDTVTVVKPAMQSAKEELFDRSRILTDFGIEPSRLPEIWALSGDETDGIPGVSGVGEKTAIALIKKYGSLDEVLKSQDKKVIGQEDAARLAFRLIELDGHMRCPMSLDDLCFQVGEPSLDAIQYLDELEFFSIKQRWLDGNLLSEKPKLGKRLSDAFAENSGLPQANDKSHRE